MNAEGRAFSDARYSAYMTAYGDVFGDAGGYGVADEPDNYGRRGRAPRPALRRLGGGGPAGGGDPAEPRGQGPGAGRRERDRSARLLEG